LARGKPAYQHEPVELRQVITEQGYATPLQFMRIVAWKQAKGSLAYVTLNSEADIKRWTQAAVTAGKNLTGIDVLAPSAGFSWSDWEKTTQTIIGINANQAPKHHCEPSGLLALCGVDYPVATAFLCILNPRAWPVMDRYSLETVFGDGSPKHHYRAVHYRTFTEHLATEGRRHWSEAARIHDLDQSAMRVSDPKEPDELPAGWVYASTPPA
jgi:hypothetical protein